VSPLQIVVQDVRIHPNPAWDTFERAIQVTSSTAYNICGKGSGVGSDASVRVGATILYYVMLPHGVVPSGVSAQQPLRAGGVVQAC
jgi:hypothetical protein